MSMTEKKWQPGDVAMVRWTVNAEWRDDVCMRTDRSGVGEVWQSANGWLGDSTAKEARPLAVIDLKPNEAEFVISVLENVKHTWTTRVADALRVLIEPPIEEPTGLGAVVEDDDGLLWVRAGNDRNGRLDDNWRLTDGDKVGWWSRWDGIKAVRVLAEGVPVEADR